MPEKTRSIAGELPDASEGGNTPHDAAELAQIGLSVAREAAAYLRDVPRPTAGEWTTKGHHDFVTHVDETAEAMIRAALTASRPESGFLGEESAAETALHGLVWVVDPLDGTTNFLHGYPWWCVSIAATIDGEVVAGVIIHAQAQREYVAWVGGGAWCNDVRLHVSTISEPGQALIGTGFPFKTPQDMPEYFKQCERIFPATSGVRRAGSAALDLATVASGEFDGYWEITLAPWDMAAGMLLVTEAGGIVTDFAGARARIGHGGVVAGSVAMHAWLLTNVQGR